ncbi:hypothetical protein, partial [Rhodococcus ruber]|uniref:hypothetical protein n=1 Tax=Rhodococcus ruber TaxID=1830 RepID=UPI001C0FC027
MFQIPRHELSRQCRGARAAGEDGRAPRHRCGPAPRLDRDFNTRHGREFAPGAAGSSHPGAAG